MRKLLYFTCLVFLAGCSKSNTTDDDHSNHLATVTTTAVTNITSTSAQGGGLVSNDGGSTPSKRGICYSTSHNPTLNNNIVSSNDGGGIGSFTIQLTGLTSNTTYYARAFATNNVGVGYGNEISFTTSSKPLYSIGQRYGGGIIFYIDSTAKHGLICDTTTITASWSDKSIMSNAISFDDGAANTITIVQYNLDTGYYAAKACKDYRGGGYNDWFLPALNQLAICCVPNIFNYSQDGYWSSSERDGDHAMVLFIHGPNKGKELQFIKLAGFGVIPIRKF